jgi:hypothetical protein
VVGPGAARGPGPSGARLPFGAAWVEVIPRRRTR